MEWEIGKVTAAAALRDELEPILATVTGLPVRAVRRKLREANGNTHVRRALEDAWPWDGERLGRLTVVMARDQGLVDELVHVTGLTPRAVRRRLNANHGRKLLRNAFSESWPWSTEEVDGQSEADEDWGEDEVEGDVRGVEENAHAPVARSVRKPRGERVAGRYVLGKRLGKGGFGEVFEAWDELAERDVVLKFAANDDIAVLKHEFGQVFDLSHPHICAVSLQHDQLTGRGFLVMQHGGRSVDELIRERGAFDVGEAVRAIGAIAEALDFAHDRRVIHHDVSPGNILIDQHGVARLTDFGVAVNATQRLTTRGRETLLARTAIGHNVGYAAPEMFVRQARRASDQFSLAIVFCSMIDGVLYASPPAFRERRELSREQNRAIQRATNMDPVRRFGSCRELAAALGDAASTEPGSTSFLS